MFTEESSQQQVTPLTEEHADPPATAFATEVQRSPAPPETLDSWQPWIEVVKGVGVWVMSVVLLVLFPVVFALPYMIYKIVTSGAPTPEAIQSDKMLIFISVLGIFPTHLLTLAVAWMVVTEGGRRPFWKTIGFEWPENINRKVAILLSGGLALVLLGLAWVVTNLYGGEKTQLDMLIESSMPARFATAFVAVATAPLVEEVIYRGVVYPPVEKLARLVTGILNPALEKTVGMGVAIAFVSLLFAGVHVFQYYNNVSVILVITVLSIVLTTVRAITGKVLPSFIIHLVFNGIQSIFLVLAPFADKS